MRKFLVLVTTFAFLTSPITAGPAQADTFVSLTVLDSKMWPVMTGGVGSGMRNFTVLARNGTDENLTNVQALINFYNSSNVLVQSANSYGDHLNITGPGETVGVHWFPPSTATRYTIVRVAGIPTDQKPNRNFRINSSGWTTPNSEGYRFMKVSATNLNRDTATNVSFQANCSSASGVYSFSGPTFPGNLAAGETATLSVISSATYDPPCSSHQITIDATSVPNPMTVASIPDPPNAVAGDRKVTVSWSAPSDTGGSAISNYYVSTFVNGVNHSSGSCTTTALSCIISGLSNGTPYNFKLVAENIVGRSLESSDSVTVTPQAVVPDPPTLVRATPGDGEVTVSWTAPAYNGGSSLTGYEVLALRNGSIVTPQKSCSVVLPVIAPTSGTSCVISELTNGYSYSFIATSKNLVGTSSPSIASNIATPVLPTFDVDYDSAGGSPVASGIFSTGGQIESSPVNPIRAGYTFAGWSAVAGGKVIDFPYTPNVTNDITLYAKWTRNLVKAASTVKPTVGGTAKVSKTLTAKKGTWTGYPTPTVSYQWYACSGSISTPRSAVPTSCKKITGATKSTFKLTSAQKGKWVTVLVTGTSSGTTKTSWLAKSTGKVS